MEGGQVLVVAGEGEGVLGDVLRGSSLNYQVIYSLFTSFIHQWHGEVCEGSS